MDGDCTTGDARDYLSEDAIGYLAVMAKGKKEAVAVAFASLFSQNRAMQQERDNLRNEVKALKQRLGA